MSLTQTQEHTITLTKPAAEAVLNLLAKKNLENHALRVFISGGGCSGYQYGMALEKEQRPTDFVYEQFGVKVVVDKDSIELLSGAVVDYKDGVMESGFKIDNPNAVSSCGCGNSFRAEGQASSGTDSCK